MDEKKTWWTYERFKEDGKVEEIYINKNDYDGKLTGHRVFGVKEWLDENPEEARRLGYVKHIHHSTKYIDYNKQTQYLMRSNKIIDEYTYEDEYHILDKTPEMMRDQELGRGEWVDDSLVFVGGEF